MGKNIKYQMNIQNLGSFLVVLKGNHLRGHCLLAIATNLQAVDVF